MHLLSKTTQTILRPVLMAPLYTPRCYKAVIRETLLVLKHFHEKLAQSPSGIIPDHYQDHRSYPEARVGITGASMFKERVMNWLENRVPETPDAASRLQTNHIALHVFSISARHQVVSTLLNTAVRDHQDPFNNLN